MRLILLGSPREVIPVGEALLSNQEHDWVACVSQPARPVGRKRILQDPPLAAFAKANGIETFQPELASAPEFLDQLASLRPDVCITAAYGQMLSEAFLGVPARATINIHPSLLPAYRGATPVPAALLDGLQQTGVTILFTVKKLDAGAIICRETFQIPRNATAGSLTESLFRIGAGLLPKALRYLENPDFTGTPQDEASVTHCRKISKVDGAIDWDLSAGEIWNRFRAYTPWPGLYGFLGGKRVLFLQLDYTAEGPALSPGQFDLDGDLLRVGTGRGCLIVETLKPEGKGEMDARSFYHGNHARGGFH